MGFRKGQISMEYMILISFVTAVIIAIMYLAVIYSNEVGGQVAFNQLDSVSKKIAAKAEEVYYFGSPTKTTIGISLPRGVQSAEITQNRIFFSVLTNSGVSDVIWKSNVNISGVLPTDFGYHDFVIEARDGYVWINGT